MPTLAAGASFNQVLSAGNSVRIQTTHNVSGRIRFVPSNAELPPPANSSRSFGPLPVDQTFGPWGMPGTVFVDCEANSATTLTYTVNDDTMGQVAITGGTINGTSVGATTAGTGRFSTLTATGAVTFTSGTINGTSVGATTRSTGAFTSLAVTRTDSSGTPGNVTNNNALGRAAVAAAASTCVVTNSLVTANSEVFVNLISTDTTLTSLRVTNIAAGSFTVTGNAAATAAATFSFLVVN